jgi:hypothetical protein
MGRLYFFNENVKRVGIDVLLRKTSMVDCCVKIGIVLKVITGGVLGSIDGGLKNDGVDGVVGADEGIGGATVTGSEGMVGIVSTVAGRGGGVKGNAGGPLMAGLICGENVDMCANSEGCVDDLNRGVGRG